MSEQRACRVIDADRESVRYRSTRDDDAGLREQLCEPINQRRRFGYRRLLILLRRERVMIDRMKTQPQACCRDQSASTGPGSAESAVDE